MTALELLDLLESTPEGPWSDKEMDRLSGIATPGDVDPTLARQFVFGRLLLEAAGVDFSEGSTSSALGRVIGEPQGRCRSHVRGSAGARMIGGEKEHVKDAQRLERCHELAVHPHESSRRTDGNSVHARTNYQELASTATDIDRRASGPYSQKSTVTLSLLSEEPLVEVALGEVRDEPRKQKKVRVRRIDRYDRGEGREVSTANRSWIGSRRVRRA